MGSFNHRLGRAFNTNEKRLQKQALTLTHLKRVEGLGASAAASAAATKKPGPEAPASRCILFHR
jgi:hypothetical protein